MELLERYLYSTGAIAILMLLHSVAQGTNIVLVLNRTELRLSIVNR